MVGRFEYDSATSEKKAPLLAWCQLVRLSPAEFVFFPPEYPVTHMPYPLQLYTLRLHLVSISVDLSLNQDPAFSPNRNAIRERRVSSHDTR